MTVIRHEAESVYDHPAVFDNAPDSFEEVGPITVAQKDQHPGNPARHHMIDGPGQLHTRRVGSCEK